MEVTVIRRFKDRYTGAKHYPGEALDVKKARMDEINAARGGPFVEKRKAQADAGAESKSENGANGTESGKDTSENGANSAESGEGTGGNIADDTDGKETAGEDAGN